MAIRSVKASALTQAVRDLCISANRRLPQSLCEALNSAKQAEPWAPAKATLGLLQDNLAAAEQNSLSVCQDTGMACVFIDIGQDVHIEGNYETAVNEGVRRGYAEGFLRKSVVADPIRRGNTGDNTPAVLTTRLVAGDKIHITVAPKGFGSENMSRIAMLAPSAGEDGVKDFIVDTVRLAGPNPCPPVVVGVGIGGTFDRVALLAKRALLRNVGTHHEDAYYADMETELLARINALGIGPQGFGGKTTALGVMIETYPTHIAGLPVAVNISCHVTRHAEVTL